jgi:hypothetical protein
MRELHVLNCFFEYDTQLERRLDMPKTIIRDFMERTSWAGSRATDLGDADQSNGLPQPLLELGYDKTKRIIELPFLKT